MNNKGADQPAHPRSLISAFVFRFLESIISRLATGKILILKLVSVAEQAGLNLTLWETQVFSHRRPNDVPMMVHCTHQRVTSKMFCFVSVDALRPSQQFSSHFGMVSCLPGVEPYRAS